MDNLPTGAVFILIGLVLIVNPLADLVLTWRRERAGRGMSSTAIPSGRETRLTFGDALRIQGARLAEEWRAVVAVGVVVGQVVGLTLAGLAWLGSALRLGAFRISGALIRDPVGQTLATLPLLLLRGRGDADWILGPTVLVAFSAAAKWPGAVLMTVWLITVVVLRPTELLATVVVAGAGAMLAARPRQRREAAGISLCVVAAQYGLLAPALALSAAVLPLRGVLTVAGWSALAIPIASQTVLSADTAAPWSLIGLAEDVREGVAAWTTAGALRADSMQALLAALDSPLAAYRPRAYDVGAMLMLAMVMTGMAGLHGFLTSRAQAHSQAFGAVRTIAAATVALVACAELLPDGTKPSLTALGLTVLVVALAWTSSARLSWEDVGQAIRAVLGLCRDAGGALALIFTGLYVVDLVGPAGFAVADIALAVVCGQVWIWFGYFERLGEVDASAQRSRTIQPPGGAPSSERMAA